MELLESHTHSFVIKIWLEDTAEEAGQARWRGLITHVPSGERRYLEHLSELAEFIIPYLEEMGIRSQLHSQGRDWSTQWKLIPKT